MLGQDHVRRLLMDTLRHSPADQTELVLTADESALTRFANSEIHQNVAETNAAVRARAAAGNRTGGAVTTRLEPQALARAVETATQIARLQPDNPDFPGLQGPVANQALRPYSETTAGYRPD